MIQAVIAAQDSTPCEHEKVDSNPAGGWNFSPLSILLYLAVSALS